jgi:hypothetical protein
MENIAKDTRMIFIESQNFRNTTCVRVETVILTYLTIRKIPFKKVHPYRKLKLLGINSPSYSVRKKNIVSFGEETISSCLYNEEIKQKIENLKKKDDFYDCLLMAITELL